MAVKYSFILPAYKAKYLREAITSILAQSYSEFELVVVDDCSPENLSTIVGSFEDSRLSYYRNEVNIGGEDLVEQWNHSVSYAKGEYIVLASDDDRYSPDYLLEMDKFVKLYPDVDILRPRVRYIDSDGSLIEEEGDLPSGVISQDEYLQLFACEKLYSGIPQYMFKRSSLLALGGFINYPLAWFSDDATVLALSKRGIAFSDRVLFEFRKSGISISTGKNSKKRVCQKSQSAILYNEFLQNNYDSDSPSVVKIRERIKRQTYYVVKDADFSSFLAGIKTIIENDKSLFGVSWYLRTIGSFIKRQIIGR